MFSVHNMKTYSIVSHNVCGCGHKLVERGERNGKGQAESEAVTIGNHPIPLETSNFSICRPQHVSSLLHAAYVTTSVYISSPTYFLQSTPSRGIGCSVTHTVKVGLNTQKGLKPLTVKNFIRFIT